MCTGLLFFTGGPSNPFSFLYLVQIALVEVGAGVMDDLLLVRAQVDPCRAILERMSSDAGETIGEGAVATTVGDLVETVVGDLPSAIPVHTDYSNGEAALRLRVPPRAF